MALFALRESNQSVRCSHDIMKIMCNDKSCNVMKWETGTSVRTCVAYSLFVSKAVASNEIAERS